MLRSERGPRVSGVLALVLELPYFSATPLHLPVPQFHLLGNETGSSASTQDERTSFFKKIEFDLLDR